jgi:hypothetical protein
MKSTYEYFVLFILIIGLISCENNNKGTFVDLTFKGIDNSVSSKKSMDFDNPVFDSASMVIGKIELKKLEIEEDMEESEDLEEYDFQGPYLIDLLAGTSEPEIPLAEIEPGMYAKAEAEIAHLEDYVFSFYLYGHLDQTNGEEQQVEFEYTYAQSEDFKIENPDGFEITADMINNVWVLIDLNALLTGVDFNEATMDVDGLIRLNKDSNRDLADIIESNLEAASELGLDEDANGEIDD